MSQTKIKVLIVDDSSVMRQMLTQILEKDERIQIIGTAADPFIAAQKIANEVPDVITLDVEMPRMDGLTFLKKIMSQHPIPVVIISSLTAKGTETALHALELGAVDVVDKMQLNTQNRMEAETNILSIVKGAYGASVRRKSNPTLRKVIHKPSANHSMLRTTERIVVVGASTGGTEAILEFLSAMPLDCPGIVIVQHMPEAFTTSFANRLNNICKISVREASDGDSVLRGHALIAPGNKHTEVRRSGARYYVTVHDGERVNRHRPSVDVLFNSAAKYAGRNVYGVILTGMGSDGAKGMLQLKQAGANTVAQDERTCVVFGMPKEAIRLNAVDKTLPISQIAAWIIDKES